MGWFESRGAKERKFIVKNAIAVMMADGKVTKEEEQALADICGRVGITQTELKELLDNPAAVKFTPAKNPRDRYLQLADMVYMMIADGEIDRAEMDMCMQMAVMLGFGPTVIHDLINAIVEHIKGGDTREKCADEIEAFLGN